MNSHVATYVKASPASAKFAVVASEKSASVVEKSLPILSPTTSSGASHTPSLNIPITPIEVEEVEYGSEDVHRSSSVRDSSYIGTESGKGRGSHGGRGGRPPQLRKPKNMFKPSSAWEHFTRDETSSQDDPMSHCNYCRTAYKCYPKINETSSMLYHVTSCPKYKIHKTRQDKSQQMFIFEAKKREANALMITKYDEKKIRHALTEMVIKDEMHFVFVDGTRFKKFMKIVEHRFNILSHFTVMRDCVKIYLRTKSDLKHMFMTNNQRVCLTINAWTSIQNMNYMCVTAYFINHQWTLHRRLLSFHQMSNQKGITIERALEECLVE
jgi:hypothetical protein